MNTIMTIETEEDQTGGTINEKHIKPILHLKTREGSEETS